MSSDLFGTFSEPTSNAVGDPYKKPQDNAGRFGGKQFSITAPKSGKAPDAYIDKQVRSLALGDRYVDAWILDKRLSRIPGKPLSDKPFFRSVGTNNGISCGPGSNNGCISKDMPFDTDGSAAALRSNPPRRPADKLRNIYTSAPKKGGFGQPWKDMTLGEPPKYYSDVYEGGREKEKELRQTFAPMSAKPFVSAANPPRPFTPDADLCQRPGSVSPSRSPAGRSSSSSPANRRPSSAPRERPQRPQSAPWRPSSPSKQGAAFCVLSHVGRNYVPDPVREAAFHGRASSATKPFRPVSGSRARLSMWSPNPFATDPRAAPDIDFTIT